MTTKNGNSIQPFVINPITAQPPPKQPDEFAKFLTSPEWLNFIRDNPPEKQFPAIRALTLSPLPPHFWANWLALYVKRPPKAAKRVCPYNLPSEVAAVLMNINEAVQVLDIPVSRPARCPYWLIPYGYSQEQYLQDLMAVGITDLTAYVEPWVEVAMRMAPLEMLGAGGASLMLATANSIWKLLRLPDLDTQTPPSPVQVVDRTHQLPAQDLTQDQRPRKGD